MTAMLPESEHSSDPSCALHREVLATVRQYLAQLLFADEHTVVPSSRLLDLGAQSLDFVELVSRLEQNYSITLPRQFTLPDDHTVGAYIQAVTSALSEGTPDVRAAGL